MEMPLKKARPTFSDFSLLPHDIVKRIMKLLSPKEVALMSFVCTSWYRIWASHPVYAFHFCQHQFNCRNFGSVNDHTSPEQKKAFLNYVHDILGLLPSENKNGVIQTFFLQVEMLGADITLKQTLSRSLDCWISILSRYCIKQLGLNLIGCQFSIPRVLARLVSLVSLSLTGVRLHENLLSEGFCFPFLRELSVSRIYAGAKSLEKLLCSCPLLENFLLEDLTLHHSGDASGTVRIFSNPKLKVLSLQKINSILKVDNVPNLEILSYHENYTLEKLDVPTCESLKELRLSFHRYDLEEDLNQFLIKFPLLENLIMEISSIEAVGILNLLNPRLKSIELSISFPQYPTVSIFSQNLHSVTYNGRGPPTVILTDISEIQFSALRLSLGFAYLDDNFFFHLRTYLWNFRNHNEVLLEKVVLTNMGETRAKPYIDAEGIPLIGNVKHFVLRIEEEGKRYDLLWSYLLSSCRPQHVTFEMKEGSFEIFDKLVKGFVQNYQGGALSSSHTSTLLFRKCHIFTLVKIDIQCKLLGANWRCNLVSVEFQGHYNHNECWDRSFDSMEAAIRSSFFKYDKPRYTKVDVSFTWKELSS